MTATLQSDPHSQNKIGSFGKRARDRDYTCVTAREGEKCEPLCIHNADMGQANFSVFFSSSTFRRSR